MNSRHLRTFVWLRYRLFINQLRRGGLANVVVLSLLAVLTILFALFMFGTMLFVGLTEMKKADPAVHMLIWDFLGLMFLFFWAAGVFAELQRSEALALEKLLHLPVSLAGAFVLNYVSSLFSLTLVFFTPVVAGLVLGMTISIGPEALLLVPMFAAFVFMISAITYQFQGWLATLMANKRRRRTIIVIVTLAFVILAQLPNLFNMYWFRASTDKKEEKIQQILNNQERAKQELRDFADTVAIVNMVVPPGWLALGARGVMEGNLLTVAACFAGMTLIGAASLRRAYRTTLRYYTGGYSGAATGERQQPKAEPARPRPTTAAGNMLERRLPWLPEQAAVTALACFRSFLRAPEVKMLLLSPVFLLLIFGGVSLRTASQTPEEMRPFIMFGALCMNMVFLLNLMNNQFGFDRGGFRIYVLCPAPRWQVLLGKNLAVLPFALLFGLVIVTAVQVVYPMRLDLLLAVVPQAIAMFLIFCMLSNVLSILAPVHIPAGAMRPTKVKPITTLLHLAFFFAIPVSMSPMLLPMVVEQLVDREGIGLALSVVECLCVIGLYRLALPWQGLFLQSREQRILQEVTTKEQ